MTLHSYNAEKLEKLALRILDLAAALRSMAQDSRVCKIEEIPINDKKALQWCESLEIWIHKTRGSFDIILEEAKRKQEKQGEGNREPPS